LVIGGIKTLFYIGLFFENSKELRVWPLKELGKKGLYIFKRTVSPI